MRKCVECSSEKTYIWKDKNTEKWYRSKDKDGFLCMKCYKILIGNPRRTPEYIKKYNGRRTPEQQKKYSQKWNPILNKKWNPINHPKTIRFKEKQIILEENPRKGYCNFCKKSVGDEYINNRGKTAILKTTHIHHINYHDDNPLKDTIELCPSCHAKVSKKQIEITVI